MINSKKLICLCLFTTSSILLAAPALSTPQPDRDPELERSITYSLCFNRLVMQPQPSPFGIAIGPNGVGHLQSYLYQSNKVFGSVPISLDWVERTSFSNPKTNKLTQLNLAEAEKYWGKPQKHVISGHEFYSFEVKSVRLKQVMDEVIDEENLYHLDLSFDDKGLISGYRVRGIGISKPEWITADWKP